MLKLYKHLKPYTSLLILILILLGVQVATSLWLPTLMADIVDKGIIKGDTSYIVSVGGKMLIVTVIGMIAMIIATFFISKVGIGFARDLRSKLFKRVESFSQADIDKIGIASLTTRTTNDITQVSTVTITILRMMVTAPIMMVGGVIMAIDKSPKLSIVLAFSVPILIIVIAVIGSKGVPLFKSIQSKLDKVNLVMREKLNGIRVIRAFNKSEFESVKFNAANKDLTDTSIKVNKLMGSLQPVLMLILNLTTVALVWIGAIKINDGSVQIGDLMAIIQYAMQIMFSLIMMAMMFVMIPRGAASAKRINEVFDIEPSIKDDVKVNSMRAEKGSIEFKDVAFAYEGAEAPVLSDISFAVNSGETLSIIGGTGSGKSTLVSLIPRLYDITSGEILLNGVNIKDVSQEELRENIGYVPQKAILFSGTIEENIRYGKEDATDEEVKHAAQIAQASEFIVNMENEYKHEISQGGTNVSGGQKQRLSIARALVRKPSVYVFDDSFSALDFKTDAKLRAGLKDETKDSAVIVVTQRISSAKDSDKIIVLDEGRIAGMGTHKELAKNCPLYKEIALSQLSKEEMENEFN
ncbi:ABC transporter ATP-binding protein [uncultured Clostridium sp.]|jgi:ATP-binding cassette subfamily B protein|uniref:ABC transporter ATP-binding protein n=1 Tax=uncultured Clostridium sp. TaxID=59620 RepID=UPI002617F03F|nr:ABC transporter ATP-binding protein [uncultured Clostridium sp.]